jgi:hypothetical protein
VSEECEGEGECGECVTVGWDTIFFLSVGALEGVPSGEGEGGREETSYNILGEASDGAVRSLSQSPVIE